MLLAAHPLGALPKPRQRQAVPLPRGEGTLGFRTLGSLRAGVSLPPRGSLGGARPRTGKVGSDQSLHPQRPLCSSLL